MLKLPPEADDLLSAWEPYAPEATGGHLWGIGGGTILATRWKHRISIDLDVFLRESEWVERFADPARPGMESLRRRFQMECGYRVQAQGSRGVKIGPIRVEGEEGEEEGWIDVIALPNRAGAVEGLEKVRGRRTYPVLDTSTILAAKLLGRGIQTTGRDVYDFAVAWKRDPKAAVKAMAALANSEIRALLSALASYRPPEGRIEETVRGANDQEAGREGKARMEQAAKQVLSERQSRKRGRRGGMEK